jgi:hypothetical protein
MIKLAIAKARYTYLCFDLWDGVTVRGRVAANSPYPLWRELNTKMTRTITYFLIRPILRSVIARRWDDTVCSGAESTSASSRFISYPVTVVYLVFPLACPPARPPSLSHSPLLALSPVLCSSSPKNFNGACGGKSNDQ